jgi:hypothetical protein
MWSLHTALWKQMFPVRLTLAGTSTWGSAPGYGLPSTKRRQARACYAGSAAGDPAQHHLGGLLALP